MSQQRIRGVLAPVTTPFDHQYRPDHARFVTHCQWLLQHNSGLAVFGTNSEGNSLSSSEKIALLDSLTAAGLDASRMMPGTGCNSIAETVQLTAHAVQQGCAGVLMLPPFYYKGVSDEGLYRHFSEVIQRVGDERLRVYLYHIPPVAAVGISPALVDRLLKAYPTAIAGMKDSSGDWNNTRTFLTAFAKSGFDVFAGAETFLLANMRHGGAGCISATANVDPAAIHDLFLTWQDNSADAKQTALDKFRNAVTKSFPMIAALKATIAQQRNDAEWARVRPPLVELSPAESTLLTKELQRINFRMPGL